jgi:hypothetical protein
MTAPAVRLCDCGCQTSFIPPPSAPHKRFATDACRNRWHAARRDEAYRALREWERAMESASGAEEKG